MFPGFSCLPISPSQLNLAIVLRSGQTFRWNVYSANNNSASPTQEWRYCARDRVFCLRQTDCALWWKAVYPDGLDTPEREDVSKAWIRDYFQLDVDLGNLYSDFSTRDPVFSTICHNFTGLPILRQDPWDTLISFICSANNNIARITKMVQSLATKYSPPLLSLPNPECPSEQLEYHPFPHPSDLAASTVAQELRSLGFGYRSAYIQRTAAMLVEKHTKDLQSCDSFDPPEQWLLGLRTLDTAAARDELLKFVGVGRKVADCILLFSLDKHDVVPVDTHVLQIASKYYNFKTNGKTAVTAKNYDAVATKLTKLWGNHAGWAHSILFASDLRQFSTTPRKEDPPDSETSPTKRKVEMLGTSSDVDIQPVSKRRR